MSRRKLESTLSVSRLRLRRFRYQALFATFRCWTATWPSRSISWPPPTYRLSCFSWLFFFNDPATTEIYTLSLHDALPISIAGVRGYRAGKPAVRRRDPKPLRHCRRGLGGGYRIADFSILWQARPGSDPGNFDVLLDHCSMFLLVAA